MQVILLVVVGAINQSKYVPMMSLAVVGTLTNQNLLGLHRGLCWSIRGLRRSMRGSTWVNAGVYAGLHGGLHGSTQGSTRGSMPIIIG